MKELDQILRNALVTQFRVRRDALDENTALFSSGLIDSLSVMDLVLLVENEIGQPVPPEDITLENFDSIARILAFVKTLGVEGKNT